MRLVFIGGILLLIVFLSGYFYLAKYIITQANLDTTSKADAIVILGARAYIAGTYNPCLVARIDHAVELYHAGYAGKILFSGGDDKEDNVNEAETMRKIALEKGIPSRAILEEKRATSTYENFAFSAPILQKHKLKSVIIVTEPFHIARAELVAKKLGYTFRVSPVMDSPCWPKNFFFTKYFLKEPFAIVGYMLQGKL